MDQNVVPTISHNKYKDEWIINVSDTQRIEFKVKTIE